MPLSIDLDVAAVAKRWSNSPRFARFMQAMILAEGPRDDRDAITRAVAKTVGVATRAAALEIQARTLVHALVDFPSYLTDLEKQNLAPDDYDREFIRFLGSRWAPLNVANDPTNKNRNWITNVFSFWSQA